MDALGFASNQLGRAVTWTGGSRFTAARRATGSCVVLVYHQVAPTCVHCTGGSAIRPEAFAEQMRMLARSYSPISLEELVSALTKQNELPARAVHVTFDDGYQGVLEYAAPVLAAERIPASVYVCPAIVDRGVFWWDDLCDALTTAQNPRLRLTWNARPLDLDVHRDHVRACAVLRRLIARGCAPYPPEQAVLWLRNELCSKPLRDTPRTLTWRDLAELRDMRVATGSHTMTHARLSDLDTDDLECELMESKRVIEERLGETVSAVAFPYGDRGSYDARVLATAEAAGYALGFTGRFGLSRSNESPFELPRVPMSPDDSRALVAAKLSGAFPIIYRFVQQHVPRTLLSA